MCNNVKYENILRYKNMNISSWRRDESKYFVVDVCNGLLGNNNNAH
jgi:hypothetical protein